jgi:murein DD-endopeptidase MepM/ murein hydrolase activator NlpD
MKALHWLNIFQIEQENNMSIIKTLYKGMKKPQTGKKHISSQYGVYVVDFSHKIALAICLSVLLVGGTLQSNSALATTVSGEIVDEDWRDLEPRINLSADGNPDKAVIIPTSRPNPALTLAIAPIDMLTPESRPDRNSLFKKAVIDFDEAYLQSVGTEPSTYAKRIEMKRGDGLSDVISSSGFDGDETKEAIKIILNHLSLRSLPIGFAVDLISPGENRATHPGAIRVALEDDFVLSLYQTEDSSWEKQISIRPVERYLTYTNGVISTSLYDASIKAGMSDDVFNTFAQVLSFSVDFQREIKKGDQFEALFEVKKDPISGKTHSSNELYYLSMTLSDDRIEFFRHEHADGTIGWYDVSGNSASRTLMRTPVNGARLSSGFGKRKHPVLGYSRIHRGVDFAVRTGTPIMAAGSGVIEYSGRNGNYGKYVRIRHNSTYKTAYAHMSKIEGGVTVGTRVEQGDVIGYVGSTGLSTGPHLHYEILVNDKKTNPLTVSLPAGQPLPDDEQVPFERSLASISDELISRGIIRFAEK